MTAVPSTRFTSVTRPIVRSVTPLAEVPAQLGHITTFIIDTVAGIRHVATTYRRQTLLYIQEFAWGRGAVLVGGGTAVVLVILGMAVGASIGIQGYASLDLVGMGSLTGFISSYANTRELAPMIAAIGFAAQAGCRLTAEIGSMRIAEEIDALESMAVRPIPYVVSTRVVAAITTIIPLYIVTLILSFAAAKLVVILLHGQSGGTYDFYFNAFLKPQDLAFSVIKVLIFVVSVVIIHSYQGFYATGGAEGVGRASGRAIRSSLIVIVVEDMILTLLMWGFDSGVRISG
ncbi:MULTISPECIES: ABC transporter permease [Gordonia]|uniref:Putative YrbE family protein n=2 Tax=Gordonia TaxID=2053 RepID=F9VY40_9ACTN|nr:MULTISPECIES: ABC transporter permease [Gordonia]NLG54479.1 ABC transporter permease [Rhodococcus sp. (in: high G+C Gram-positive bacteria)]MDH3009459.1 ABC transporter permease [Gordonia alkanivorans]MDH3013908.1 ABC transporter permease [Gordonia alkanivorans]MDH3018296.1 ABC transporter permease [Gordonia alkanivorans]MDH3022711.1 ABC transporter permease [Gordonia alkanivorans]